MDFTLPCFEDDATGSIPVAVAVDPLQLHENILSYGHRITTEMMNQCGERSKAFMTVQTAVQGLWSQGQTSVYGSLYGPPETQFALPHSDIDVAVGALLVSPLCTDKKLLDKLQDRLQLGEDCTDSKVVAQRGRSVLRCVIREFEVDVTIDSKGPFSGFKSGEFQRLASERHPQLRPLTLVVKQLLHRHRLNDPYNGGLTGYGVVLLTLRFLLDREPELNGESNLGTLLHQMLSFYGEAFSAATMGIRVKPGESYIFCEEDGVCPWKYQPLYIEDPIQRGNNVGSAAWCFPQIQKLFVKASVILRETGRTEALWAI